MVGVFFACFDMNLITDYIVVEFLSILHSLLEENKKYRLTASEKSHWPLVSSFFRIHFRKKLLL